jgi:hypothetical protein
MHLETTHQHLWNTWIEQDKGLKGEKNLQKRSFPTPSTFYISLWGPNHYVHQGNTIYFAKNYHMDQKEWEEVTRVAQGIFA